MHAMIVCVAQSWFEHETATRQDGHLYIRIVVPTKHPILLESLILWEDKVRREFLILVLWEDPTLGEDLILWADLAL